MRRRQLLASLPIVGLAGCLDRSNSGELPTDRTTAPTSTEQHTDTREPTPTPTPGIGTLPDLDCPEEPAVPYRADEDVPPVPDPPEEFTSEAVRE